MTKLAQFAFIFSTMSFSLASPGVVFAQPATVQTQPPRGAVPPPPEGYVTADRIAALVGDDIITLHEVDKAATSPGALEPIDGANMAEIRQKTLEALIDNLLVLGQAKELGIEATDAEIDDYVTRVKAQNGLSQEQLEENIARLGMTLPEYRELTRKELVRSRTLSVKVRSRINITATDVQRVLDAEFGGGTEQDEVRASILLRRVPPNATMTEINDIRRYIEWIRSQADAAPERFADLARKYSEHDATRLDGGDIGYISQGLLADEALESTLFRTPVGKISNVIATPLGFQIVYVTDKRKTPVKDPEALRDSIYDRLFTEARAKVYETWVKELREQTYVEIRL
ncbi:MAG: peptidylprolyl isomerase [Myxococcales bacterium]|nr:peptidylprolyl isomerase [Myxococcales bacterium]